MSEEDKKTLTELWADDSLCTKDIAARLEISMTSLYRESKALKLPKRYSGKRQAGEVVPTTEEIEKRSAEIRAGWSRRQAERRGGGGSRRWRPPAYRMSVKDLVFSS